MRQTWQLRATKGYRYKADIGLANLVFKALEKTRSRSRTVPQNVTYYELLVCEITGRRLSR